jgi:hypothetical protein
MTADRDLWQQAHDEDCPNKAMLETVKEQLARMQQPVSEEELNDSDLCALADVGEWFNKRIAARAAAKEGTNAKV